MSGLDVSGQTALSDASTSGLVPASTTPIATEMLRHDSHDGHSTNTYPSPSSTISPCQSPHADETGAPCFPMSTTTSELAFALRDHQAASTGNSGQHIQCSQMADSSAGVSVSPRHPVPFFYVSGESDAMYAPAETASTAEASSSLSLPMMEFAPDKFSFEGDISHYHPSSSIVSYAPVDGRRYSADGSFTSGGNKNQRDALHGMEFAAPADVYGAAFSDHPTTLDPSSLDSSHKHSHGNYNAYT